MRFELLGVLVLAACAQPSSSDQRICTLIGCNDGLNVQVSSLAQSATVTVRAGNQVIGTFRCDPGNPCQSFIQDQTPNAVNVTVEVSGGTVNRNYTPEYRTVTPNGEGCPPACRQATVTVAVN
jgi:hypothetical protein